MVFIKDFFWWLLKSNLLTSFFLQKFGVYLFPRRKDCYDGYPLTNKDDLKIICSNSRRKLLSIKGYSSGTTNTPVVVFRTVKSIFLEEYIIKSFVYGVTGLLSPKAAVIRGDLLTTSADKFWLNMPFSGRLIMSSFHISQSSFLHYLKKLNQFKPDIIMAYPSSLTALAKYADTINWRPNWYLRGVFTSSETWNDTDRELCERIFGSIYDHYGQAERVAVLQQCEHKIYHVRHDYSSVEFVKEGELFRIIGSNRHNSAMPLQRYDTGDYVAEVCYDYECMCGITSDCVPKIIGRQDDIVYLKDGRALGRLDVLFKKMNNLLACQIVQDAVGDIHFNIVPINESFSKQLVADVRQAFEEYVGQLDYVEYVIVHDVPRTRNGKFKSVISEFKAEVRIETSN